jgi:hypothetical protein
MTKPNVRSRYLINHKEKFIVFVNFKCGFTAINSAAARNQDIDTSIINPAKFQQWLLNNDISQFLCYFISRNPLSRLVSYYYNWIVVKNEVFFYKKINSDVKNKHFENLKNVMTIEDYCLIAGATSKQKVSPEMFTLFLKYLPEFFMLDPHTMPQHNLFSAAGMKFSEIDRVIDNSDMANELSALLGKKIPQLNMSAYTETSPDQLLSSVDLTVVEQRYARDYEYFAYQKD